MTDTSVYCRRADSNHAACDGSLRGKTGHHWWCVCSCHPDEPKPRWDTADARKALMVWRKARTEHEGTGKP